MSLIAWTIVGLVVGALVKFVIPSEAPRGCIITMLLGVVGSLAGGFVATLLGYGGISGLDLRSIMVSFLGTLMILGPWLLLTRSRPNLSHEGLESPDTALIETVHVVQAPGSPSSKERVALPEGKFWDTPAMIAVLIILAVLTGGIYGLVVLLDRTLTAETLQSMPVKLAVSATMLVGAILLYMIKVSAAQFIYGLTEIAVGLVANWRSLEALARQLASPSGEDPLFARLAVLAGGLYLIGRGVANFAEGMKRIGVTRESAEKRVQSMKSGITTPNPEAAPDS